MKHQGTGPYTLIWEQHRGAVCQVSRVLLELTLFTPYQSSRCASWTWYIQTDFHMYIVVLLVVMFTKGKNQRLICLAVLLVLSLVATVWYSYRVYLANGMVGMSPVYHSTFFRLRLYLAGSLLGYYKKMSKSPEKKEGEELGETGGEGVGAGGRGGLELGGLRERSRGGQQLGEGQYEENRLNRLELSNLSGSGGEAIDGKYFEQKRKFLNFQDFKFDF